MKGIIRDCLLTCAPPGTLQLKGRQGCQTTVSKETLVFGMVFLLKKILKEHLSECSQSRKTTAFACLLRISAFHKGDISTIICLLSLKNAKMWIFLLSGRKMLMKQRPNLLLDYFKSTMNCLCGLSHPTTPKLRGRFNTSIMLNTACSHASIRRLTLDT
jgi:excinuclease UvrABC helicase subunit UvrB